MALPIIGAVVSGLFGIGEKWMDRKQEEAQAKHDRKMTQIKNDADWDTKQAENSGNSWKDEYLTIILTMPFVVMFVAAAVGADQVVTQIKDAFIVLKTDVPDEYWYLLAVVVAASFGVKKVIDGIQKLRGGK